MQEEFPVLGIEARPLCLPLRFDEAELFLRALDFF